MIKKIISLSILTFTLCVSSAVFAEDNPCSNTTTKTEMIECGNQQFKKADNELTKSYKQLMKRDVRHRKQLLKTELNWIKWKDYECEYQGLMYEGGTAQPGLIQSCLTRLTKERTEHLKYVLDGYNSF